MSKKPLRSQARNIVYNVYRKICKEAVEDEPQCSILKRVQTLIAPGPPTNIRVYAAIMYEMLIYWDAPDPGSKPIEYYVASMKRQGEDTWKIVEGKRPASTRGIVIKNLPLATNYTFRVRAVSEVGPGEQSEELFFRTAWTTTRYGTWRMCAPGGLKLSKAAFCVLVKSTDVYKATRYSDVVLVQKSIEKLLKAGTITKEVGDVFYEVFNMKIPK